MSLAASTTNKHLEREYLFLILGIGLVARLYVCFLSGLPLFMTDTFDYFKMADAIIRGAPYSYFPNGYPLIIAGTKFVFGPQQFQSALLILNIMMSTIVLWFAFQISRRIYGTVLALWIVALLAVWPNQINYVRQLLSEVPSSFFLLFGIFLLIRGNYVSSGILLYFAGMIRSALLPVGIVLVVWMLWQRRSAQVFFFLWGIVAAFAADLLLQNLGLIKPTGNFGLNFLIAIRSTSTEGIQWTLDGFTQEQLESPLTTYLAFAMHHPLEFVSQRLSSLWELWGPWPAPTVTIPAVIPRGVLPQMLIAIRFPALLLAIYGFWTRRTNFEVGIIAIPILTLTLVHFWFFSYSRYTYPVEPLLLMLAVAGANELWRRIRWTGGHSS